MEETIAAQSPSLFFDDNFTLSIEAAKKNKETGRNRLHAASPSPDSTREAFADVSVSALPEQIVLGS